MARLAKRGVLVLAMVASLLLATPVLAVAKTTLTPTQEYRLALHTYNHQRYVINRNFNDAIAKDRAVESAALAAATSVAQKYLARVNFNQARALDVAKWETALKKLGSAPQPPTATHSTTTTPLA